MQALLAYNTFAAKDTKEDVLQIYRIDVTLFATATGSKENE